MSEHALRALVIGVGVTLGLWFLWWRTGQMPGPRRLVMALAAGGFSGLASLVISQSIAAV